jgi:hypothetical protein
MGRRVRYPPERGIVVPRRKKSEEDEIDEIVEDLDDLEEDDEEVDDDDDVDEEDEDDEDDDEEDPDEAPKSKSKKSKKSKRSGIGTKEVAAAAGVEPRVLRGYLRTSGTQPRDEREGRYTWPSLNDPEVKRIIKAVKSGAAERENKKAVEKTKGKKTSSKKSTSRKRKTAA